MAGARGRCSDHDARLASVPGRVLAGQLLSGANDQAVERCVARAQGNPLLLERLLRHVRERSDDALPATVQTLMQARIDRLAPNDREALRAASVFGQGSTLPASRAARFFAGQNAGLYAQHLDRAADPADSGAYAIAARQQADAYRNEAALELAIRGLEIATDSADRFALACLIGQLQPSSASGRLCRRLKPHSPDRPQRFP